MNTLRIAGTLAVIVAALALLVVLVQRVTRHRDEPTAAATENHHEHANDQVHDQMHDDTHSDYVEISSQARKNLQLVCEPLRPEVYWKTIELPGRIVDRPGVSDRGVVAPITGVVREIHRLPGDTARPGEVLFTLRLLSESMQVAQRELLKAARETQIVQQMKDKLEQAAATGGIAQVRITELENELKRLAVSEQAYRLELQTRGLTPAQIEDVVKGRFTTEMQIRAPQHNIGPGRSAEETLSATPAAIAAAESPLFELQELKVELGEQVQAGQTLCVLSQHQSLFIEGHAFRHEVPLVQRAIEEQVPVDVEFMEDESSRWEGISSGFTVHHIANTMDSDSRTFAFYIPLLNESRSYRKDGRTMLLWRFRPGQHVRVRLRVEKLQDVFVLPRAAVVREGPESYVFGQRGDRFERHSVRVLHQDRHSSVVANDGSIRPGEFVARSGAAELNRVLKAQTTAAAPHDHHH